MMMPSISTSSSSVSATIRVDKATSELLAGPDWTLNMEICDICNSNNWLAKDAVKEVKRRLQNKNPKVQLLTLTLLETMVKNCGEYIHFHIGERKILDEMIKMAKKKADMHVRNRILILLDSWQEAFGGPGGKYSQYYWACDELRRCGVQFPQRPQRSAPVITPPVTHPTRVSEVGFGMPANSSRRLDEAMTSEVEGLSFSTLESMRNVLELLDDMLQAVNPNDRVAVKDEVIIDLVDRCRANQKKLMQMITTTTDEELLAQGLELNDSLQSVLAKHDALASGAPLPIQGSLSGQPSESVDSSLKISEARDKNPALDGKSSASATAVGRDQGEEDEEEEDEFAQLARRHSKSPSQSVVMGATDDAASSSSSNSNALVLIDAPVPAPAAATATSTKEQDLIDLLSIVLTTSSTTPETPQAPNSAPAETAFQESFNNYVVPWAQPQPQQAVQPLPQYQTPYQSVQPQFQPQSQQGYSGYPPPPWEATSGYGNYQNPGSNPYMSQGTMNGSSMPMQGVWPSQNFNSYNTSHYGNQPMYQTAPTAINSSTPMQQGMRSLQQTNSFQNPAVNGNAYSTPQANSPTPMQGVRTLQHTNSLPARANGSAANGTTPTANGSNGIPSGQKPFIPSYRLFEDLNVFGSTESKLKSGPYPSASGNPNQNMIAGRR